jgi:hypothetical protein
VFWAAGLFAWIWSHDRAHVLGQIGNFLKESNATAPLAITIAALVLITISGVVAQPLALPVLRLLEGYWPPWLEPLRRFFLARKHRKLRAVRRRWGELAARELADLSPHEVNEYAKLDQQLARAPIDQALMMPTTLGNILRAAETRPRDKYGLNPIVCWPRLWLVLPESAQADLNGVRSKLDGGALVVLWGVWVWWIAPLAVVVAIASYRWMLSQAQLYGDLFEACFDVYRKDLYEALGYTLPTDREAERAVGAQVTAFLWRG